MKGLAPLFLGIFGTFAFSWVGLTVLPNWQIGHLNPQSDEEGTDIEGPVPPSPTQDQPVAQQQQQVQPKDDGVDDREKT